MPGSLTLVLEAAQSNEGILVDVQFRDRADTVGGELAEFIVNELNWDGTKEELLAGRVELSSILDSTELLELAGFLEDQFNVVIDDSEIVAETFASVSQLAEFVVSKQLAATA